MRTLKAISILVLLVIWGILNIAMCRNEHLVARAGETEDLQEKIACLKEASAGFPIDHRAPYELGKAHFNLALQNLGIGTRAEEDLRLSVADLRRSIRLNPFSAFSHFQLGQSLLYLGTVSSAEGEDFLEEYRKAVSLANYNSQFLLEVGKTCLMHWKGLSEKDRDFALDVLKKVLDLRDPHRAQIIFQAWEMNSGDLGIMRNVLPKDPRMQRAYADFLAEKSLAVGERQLYLAKAELLEFEAASEELRSAENALSYLRIEQASELLQFCLNGLRKIRFYQDLTREILIDPEEYRNTLRSCWLNLAKCGIEAGQGLKDVQAYLENYLALEDRVSSVNELEVYLIERGLIEERNVGNSDDPDKTAFRLGLFFKKNRYQDIVQWGRSFQPNLAAIPSPKKKAYTKVFQILGDAYQKAGFLYDSREYYKKALELDPFDVGTLVRMRMSAERLNSETEIRDAEDAISRGVSRQEIISDVFSIRKGEIPSWRLRLDGRPHTLDLRFTQVAPEPFPLLSIVFNDRVIWEGYVDREALTVPLKPEVGDNLLVLTCLNRTVSLDKLTLR
jgi:tetratricopeptide (TPR) repeat protein